MRNYLAGFPFAQQREPLTETEPIEGWGWRPQVGDSRTFIPASFTESHCVTLAGIDPALAAPVTGTVVQVSEERRWYRVRYTAADGSVQHECFKF